MTPEQWQRVKSLFQAAIERPPAGRESFLAAECGADATLRAEVETLIEAYERNGSPVETAALGKSAGRAGGAAAGSRFGAYMILREIGSGGMGEVYLAERSDDEFRRQVAIKLVRRGMALDFVLRRFRNERQILASLEHPGIAGLLDGGTTEDGLPFLVMEYVEGLPIDRYCDEHRLGIRQRLVLFREVCSAVQHAHQHLVVHRDLKPGNILVTAAGAPKLLDFGIAKLLGGDAPVLAPESTEVLVRLMTPDYASPEQVRGGPISTATDIYSLGMVLYRLLTGHWPFPADLYQGLEHDRLVLEAEPEAPSAAVFRVERDANPECVSATRDGSPERLRRRLAGDVDQIVLRALRKEPLERYRSVEQFSEDVRRHLEGYPVAARRGTLRYRWGKFARRNAIAVAAAAAGFAGLSGGLATTTWQAHVAGVERVRAERRLQDVRALANSFLFEFHDSIQNLAGATSARELIVRRGLEYLDRLAKEAGNDQGWLKELAAAYQRVGDVQGNPSQANLGDTQGALKSQRAALALRRRLASQSDDPANAADLAVSLDRVGDLLWLTGAREGALENYRASLTIRERLLGAGPATPALAHYLTTSYNNVGDLLLEARDYDGALASYRKGLPIAEDAAARLPGDVRAARDLTVAYNRMGDGLWYRSDFAGALESYRKSLAMREKLSAAQPSNSVFRRDLIAGYNNVGDALLSLRRGQEAIGSYRKAVSVAEELAAADPANVLAARDLAICLQHLGTALVEADPAAAREPLVKALAIVTRLQATDPRNAVIVRDAVEIRALLARIAGARR